MRESVPNERRASKCVLSRYGRFRNPLSSESVLSERIEATFTIIDFKCVRLYKSQQKNGRVEAKGESRGEKGVDSGIHISPYVHGYSQSICLIRFSSK